MMAMSSRAKRRTEFRKEMPDERQRVMEYLNEHKEQVYNEIDRRIALRNIPMIKEMIEEGYREGQIHGGQDLIKQVYAGVALALHEEFGFGKERVYRALSALEEHIKFALNHRELCDELMDQYGIEVDVDDMFERVKKTDE